jgi:hypothetical protein
MTQFRQTIKVRSSIECFSPTLDYYSLSTRSWYLYHSCSIHDRPVCMIGNAYNHAMESRDLQRQASSRRENTLTIFSEVFLCASLLSTYTPPLCGSSRPSLGITPSVVAMSRSQPFCTVCFLISRGYCVHSQAHRSKAKISVHQQQQQRQWPQRSPILTTCQR